MDCAGDDNTTHPTIMWEPNKSKITKMDQLRQLINQKYSANLSEFNSSWGQVLFYFQFRCFRFDQFWKPLMNSSIVQLSPLKLKTNISCTKTRFLCLLYQIYHLFIRNKKPAWFSIIFKNAAQPEICKNILKWEDLLDLDTKLHKIFQLFFF